MQPDCAVLRLIETIFDCGAYTLSNHCLYCLAPQTALQTPTTLSPLKLIQKLDRWMSPGVVCGLARFLTHSNPGRTTL
jgi:hypothetical protein